MDDLYATAKDVASELVAKAKLIKGKIVVVGCSTSEVLGDQIGTNSSKEVAYELFRGLKEVFDMYDIFIAAQCCEHLNRGIIIEQESVKTECYVNVVPQTKAGGSFASIAYKEFIYPVAVEEIQADVGLDIGGTLIGMNLKKIAVLQ